MAQRENVLPDRPVERCVAFFLCRCVDEEFPTLMWNAIRNPQDSLAFPRSKPS